MLRQKEKQYFETTSKVSEFEGQTRVLAKEKQQAAESIADLNRQKLDLSEDLMNLQNKEAMQKDFLNELKIESENLSSKKSLLERELKDLLDGINENYTRTEKRKDSIIVEISENEKNLNKLTASVAEAKKELQKLKEETARLELQKEEFTAKISNLAALEQRMKNGSPRNSTPGQYFNNHSGGEETADE